MGKINDYMKSLKIAKRTENELAKLEARLDEIQKMDIEEEEKEKLILEVLKEAEIKSEQKVIDAGVKPSKYGDQYSLAEVYWKDREDVQSVIKHQRELSTAKEIEQILSGDRIVFDSIYQILDRYKSYYDTTRRKGIEGISDNDYKKYDELKRFLGEHSRELHLLDPEEVERRLQAGIQFTVINKIKSAKTMEEQNRLFEEYVKFANKNIKPDPYQLDWILDEFLDSDFMQKRRLIQQFKELGIDFKFSDKIPTLYEATEENKEKTDEENDKRAFEKMEEPITEQDYAMVRSTNFFPEHRLIETLDKHTLPQPIGSYFESEIRELTGDYDSSKFDVLDFINRRTVHWTLNGLVGDHAYGSFSNSNYIIIEPFKNHINDEGLLNINEADTFFAQDMKLSPEATILMPLEQYKKLMSDPKTRKAINDFKIAVYTGSDKTATEMLLHDQGYVYGTIGTWGFSTERKTETQQYCGRLEEGMKEISERLMAKEES